MNFLDDTDKWDLLRRTRAGRDAWTLYRKRYVVEGRYPLLGVDAVELCGWPQTVVEPKAGAVCGCDNPLRCAGVWYAAMTTCLAAARGGRV